MNQAKNNHLFGMQQMFIFLLTDRFENGDKTNDVNYGRTTETAKLRGFEGGDFRGVINKN